MTIEISPHVLHDRALRTEQDERWRLEDAIRATGRETDTAAAWEAEADEYLRQYCRAMQRYEEAVAEEAPAHVLDTIYAERVAAIVRARYAAQRGRDLRRMGR